MLDAVLEAGRAHGIRPFGEEALMVLRIEAGLAAGRHRVARQPARVHRRRAGHPEGARLGLDAARRPRRRAALRRQRGDPARAARRHLALGDDRHRRRPGRLGSRCTARSGCCRRCGRRRRRTSRCSTTTNQRRGRLLHELRLLADPAAAHRHGPGAARTWRRRAPVLHLELALAHHNTTVPARTTKMPFFNPERKTST